MHKALVAISALFPFAAYGSNATVTCGGVNDTSQINAALAQGGDIYIQPGVCAISNSLQMFVSGTKLSGGGQNVTVIKALAPDAFNFLLIGNKPTAKGNGASNISVSALTLDGSATQGDDITSHSIGVVVASQTANTRISNVEIRNMGQSGMAIHGSHVVVSKSYVHDNFHSGIYVTGVLNAFGASPQYFFADSETISGNTVINNSREHPQGWDKTHPGQIIWDGIDLDPKHSNVTLSGNIVSQNDILILDNTSGSDFSGPDTVKNNKVSGSLLSGIRVQYKIQGFTVQGNTLSDDLQKSIAVGGNAQNGVISGNFVTNGGGGIVTASTTKNVQIYGNTVK